MIDPNPRQRRFRVHARHIDRHYARAVAEPSFEAAAIAYVEDYPSDVSDSAEVSVIVYDIDTGHECCFHIDLNTGETVACG